MMNKKLILVTIVSRVIGFSWEPMPEQFNTRNPDSLLSLVRNTSYDWDKMPFDMIYVFGDEFCDSGRSFRNKNSKHRFNPDVYWEGRFSNGPIWVDYMEAMNRIPINSLCVAGSAVKRSNLVIEEGVPDFKGQIQVLSKEKNFQAKRPLVIFGFRSNDLKNPFLPVEKLGFDILFGVLELVDDHGIKDFVLMGATDDFHYKKNYDVEINRVKNTVMRIRPGTKVHVQKLFNVQTYSTYIAPPTSIQGRWVASACYDSERNIVCNNPDHHLLMDSDHVTTVPQYNLAGYISRSVSGYWGLE